MWTCDKCGEQHEDQFDSCWRCAGDQASGASGNPECLRCHTRIEFLGTKEFHEGTRWGLLGELGELFVNKERFDIYACPKCGHVEFFVQGVGSRLPTGPES